MPRITEVVKQLLILNILLFVASNFMPPAIRNALPIYYPMSDFFRPWQLVTHMFMHANFSHLLFNMFGLFMFGTALESRWGPKRFLIFYLATGIGALALYMLVWYFQMSALEPNVYEAVLRRGDRMLGASGAIFGLLAGYGMLYPENKIMLLIPPIPIKAKYFVLIYGAIELFMGMSNVNSGVAHFAHLGGAIFGALLVYHWKQQGKT